MAYPTLNQNKIYTALRNMITSQYVYADNVAGAYESFCEASRVDGSMLGDTKLYIACDVLKSYVYNPDSSDQCNVLAVDRGPAPATQAITLDQFRQIMVTTDGFITKQAFASEGAFSQFTSVMISMLSETKRVYDATRFNTFVGTHQCTTGSQTQTVAVSSATLARELATKAADLLVELSDVSRNFNDNHFLRSYRPEDLVIVWNADVYNQIKKYDEPILMHNEGLFGKLGAEYVLPDKYFGTVKSSGGTATGAERSLVEKDYGTTHCFPGEIIPTGIAYLANEAYVNDTTNKVAFKICHKNSIPVMSGFEVGTDFNNSKNLSVNNYLTFGYNTLVSLAQYPFVTIRRTVS